MELKGIPLHIAFGEWDQGTPWDRIPSDIQATYVGEAAVALWALEEGKDVFEVLWTYLSNDYRPSQTSYGREGYQQVAEFIYEWREKQ